MRQLSNSPRSYDFGETSWEDGKLADTSARQVYIQTIDKANSVPLIEIFDRFDISINEHNTHITCPFISHKGGRERTPSFHYYPQSNRFKCYGCQIKGKGCDFISAFENISKLKAAKKILAWFSLEIDSSAINLDTFCQLELMVEFSDNIREFRKNFLDEESQLFIEKICKIYDDFNSKNDYIDKFALQHIILTLKERIALYQACFV